MKGLRVVPLLALGAALASLVLPCPCPVIACRTLGNWVPIGPEEIVESYYAGPNSGRATVIAVNPYNKNDVWLGTATGGLWHSSDISAVDYDWVPLTDAAASLSIGAILLEECSVERCNLIWVGTGENNLRRDTYYGHGLLRLRWNAATYVMDTVGDAEERFKYGSIIDITRFNNALYIAVSKGKSCSASSTIVTAPEPRDGYGIHRSDDNGMTWVRVGASAGDALPSDMELQGGSLLVGFYNRGIYRLSPADIWSPIGPTVLGGYDHVEIAVAPSNPNVVYAAYGQCASETWLCNETPLFFVSTDGGVSWQAKSTAAGIGTYSRYTHALTVHPSDESRVYYGGIRLYFSSEYGANFQMIDVDELHPDIQDFVFPDPNQPLFHYVATDGGFYVRDRRPQVMRTFPLNHGLGTVQEYSVCSSDVDGARLLLAGLQDNGTVYFTGSPIWEFVAGGDGGDCIVASSELFYASVHEGLLGRAITTDLRVGSFENFTQGLAMDDPTLVTAPFIMHPGTQTLYHGRTRVYKRGVADDYWVAASPRFDNSTVPIPEIERQNAVSALAVAPSNPSVAYVALHSGEVWVTNGPGPCADPVCWTRVGGAGIGNGLPVSVPTSLDVDPSSDSIAYITFSDFSTVPKVWRTQDKGASWQPFSDGLPINLPLKVIKVDPGNRDIIYLGTDEGVYRRNMAGDFEVFCMSWGSEWRPYGYEHGMPRVPVYAIDFDSRHGVVYAATHGRGTYMLSEEPVVYVAIRFGGRGAHWLYLFGHGFLRDKGAEVSIAYLDREGKVVGRTSSDARGGALSVNAAGRLVAVNNKTFGSTTMVMPCLAGECLHGGKPDASLGREEISSIQVVSRTSSVTEKIKERTTIRRDPPSTLFKVHKLSKTSRGRVHFTPVLVDPKGQPISEAWAASVEIARADTDESIANTLARSVNDSSRARSKGYRARVLRRDETVRRGEDVHVPRPFLVVENSGVEAVEMFSGFTVSPGDADRLGFDVEGVGRSLIGELTPVKITFATGENGALGGSISFLQRSAAGVCRVDVETSLGQTAEEIAASVYSAVMDVRYPGTRRCEARHNSFDLHLEGESVITSSALGMSIEIQDRGVGVSVAPSD